MTRSKSDSSAKAPSRAERARAQLAGYQRSSYAVWEVTLGCNLACSHCGSRAGSARTGELDTPEAKEMIAQLAAGGIGEVTLIGGEPLLRPDLPELIRAINDHGMLCSVLTGGYGVSREKVRRLRDAGVAFISVSIDGLEASHDKLRGREGSWRQCFLTFEQAAAVGLPYGCNTQLNRISAPQLPQLYELIHAAGVTGWQVQMTAPMGNAADCADILLQPAELCDFYPMLGRVAERAHRDGVRFAPGDNVGYYGPYESILRGGEPGFWMGCQAGLALVGVEADGTIKPCSSLPRDEHTGGNIRDASLGEIIATDTMGMNLGGGTPAAIAHLWGFCAGCEYAELCRGGCSWTAHVFFGKRGNNPYCHHRAIENRKRGLRERVVPQQAASGQPFDHGLFELVLEPLDAPWPVGDDLHFTADQVIWPQGFDESPMRRPEVATEVPHSPGGCHASASTSEGAQQGDT